eukprot:TRINITY_DN1028_c0_g1_i2.p1 TRINITY_DN1028_c0_g1~~TRINITY_DN1028_c0_g1_i2.p1  ORF type:complete len:202 (-),score=55.20 TRINITY_DN1028_c0_g1_i2:9-614(-)
MMAKYNRGLISTLNQQHNISRLLSSSQQQTKIFADIPYPHKYQYRSIRSYSSSNEHKDDEEVDIHPPSPDATTTDTTASSTPSVPKYNRRRSNQFQSQWRRDKDGDNYFTLGGNQRATLKRFNNKNYIDIRLFYVKPVEEGDITQNRNKIELAPSSKGIFLDARRWQIIKENIDRIDAFLGQPSPSTSSSSSPSTSSPTDQ